MGKHRIGLGRRGVAALAAAGALVIGGTTASMMGTGSAAEPLGILAVSSPTNTIVLADLAPFKDIGTKGDGKAEVSDEVGAPTGGGKAALRLSTPGGNDKASDAAPVSEAAAKPLAAWIPTAAYSAYKIEGGAANQFPSLQLVVDFNGTAEGGFSTLTYEPVYNPGTDSLEPGQWNRYQAGAGNWCSTRAIPGVIETNQVGCSLDGAKPLSAYIAAAPNIVVTSVVINQGSGNAGVESAVDLITTPTDTYDFELEKPVVVVPTTPKPTDPTSTIPTTKPDNGNGGNNGGHPGTGNGGNGGHPGNGNGGNNGNWGENGHCGC